MGRRPARHAHAPQQARGPVALAARAGVPRGRAARRSPSSSRTTTSASSSAAPGLLDEARAEEREACQRLLAMLEKRAALLQLIGEALEPRRPFVRVGDELEHPALRDVSLVGATYGLTNRTLGAVTLLGPLRMDYDKAIR